MKNLRPQQVGILSATAVTVLFWILPFGHALLLPLQYLNTHLHEMSHALAAVLSGGSVDTISVHSDGSGVTMAVVTHRVIVGSAGYVGASLIGSSIIAFSRDARHARWALLALFGVFLIECLFWLRSDSVGMVSGFAYMAIFLILGLKLDGWPAILVAQFVGLQQCLNALQSVWAIVHLPGLAMFADNDATILKDATGVPAILWSSGWALLSLTLMALAFLYAWSGASRPRGLPPAGM